LKFQFKFHNQNVKKYIPVPVTRSRILFGKIWFPVMVLITTFRPFPRWKGVERGRSEWNKVRENGREWVKVEDSESEEKKEENRERMMQK
jgi:hypothetical protein